MNYLFLFIVANQVNQRQNALPFQICEDKTAQLLQDVDGAVGGIQVFCDQPQAKENQGSGGIPVFCDQPGPSAGIQVFCDEPGDKENQG